MMTNPNSQGTFIQATGEATGFISSPDNPGKPITVIATDSIRKTFDSLCIQQAVNSRTAPGVTDLILNPDAHCGYGAPVGCVLVSPTHIYPGPVGVDIKCSMSLLQLDLPAQAVNDIKVRRQLIDAILDRTPTGAGQGQRSVKKSRRVDATLGRQVAMEGASSSVCRQLGIPQQWAQRCEDASHTAHDGTQDALGTRLDKLINSGVFNHFEKKISQLGSYGGGNHFGECETVNIENDVRAQKTAAVFGLKHNHTAFLSHCGSRGFGYHLAHLQFRRLQKNSKTTTFRCPVMTANSFMPRSDLPRPTIIWMTWHSAPILQQSTIC